MPGIVWTPMLAAVAIGAADGWTGRKDAVTPIGGSGTDANDPRSTKLTKSWAFYTEVGGVLAGAWMSMRSRGMQAQEIGDGFLLYSVGALGRRAGDYVAVKGEANVPTTYPAPVSGTIPTPAGYGAPMVYSPMRSSPQFHPTGSETSVNATLNRPI